MDTTRAVTGKAGWRFSEYPTLVGLSRTLLYGLPPELQPRTIKVGHATVITESPADYLARLAATQAREAA